MIVREIIGEIGEGGYELSPARSIFAIVLPEATVNLVANPECVDLVGYAGVSGSLIVSDDDVQKRGVRSIRCQVDPDTPNGELGVVYTLPADLGEGDFTFSVDILGRGEFVIGFGDANGNAIDDSGVRLPGVWTRPSITTYSDGASIRTVWVRSTGRETFWVDGFQVEGKPYVTTFVSGNTQVDREMARPGRPVYGWHGYPHRSSSYRTVQARNGGRIVHLSDVGLQVTGFSGLGLNTPELTTVRMLNGMGIVTSIQDVDRQFTVTGVVQAENLAALIRRRRDIAALVSGGTPVPSPVLMMMQLFDDDGHALTDIVTLRCLYAGGMEGTINNVTGEKVTLSFAAWSGPRVDGNIAKSLTYERDPSWSAVRAIYPDGTMDALPGGENWDTEYLPHRIAIGQDLSLYACRGSRLMKWFGGEWLEAYEVDGDDVIVDACAGPDGAIYFGAISDDGDNYAKIYQLFPYTGTATHVMTLHCGSADIILGRIRSDPVMNRVYFVGNFSGAQFPDLSYPTGDYGNFDHICYYDCRRKRWGDFPNLEPNEDEGYIVYDVDVDVLGQPWIVGEFKLKGTRPEIGAKNGWGLANFNVSSRQWEAQGDYCLVNALQAPAMTEWDVEVTSVHQLGGRVIRFDANRFNPWVGGQFNIAFAYDDSIDYGLGSSPNTRRWYHLNNITQIDWVTGVPYRVGECPDNTPHPPPPPGFPDGWYQPSSNVGLMPWVSDPDTGISFPSFVDDMLPLPGGEMYISGGISQAYYVVEERRCGYPVTPPGSSVLPFTSPGLVRYSSSDSKIHSVGLASMTALSTYRYYDPWTDAVKGPYKLSAYGCGMAAVLLDPAISGNIFSAQPPDQETWADAAGWTPSGTLYVAHRSSNSMLRTPGPVTISISAGARPVSARIEVTGSCSLSRVTNRTTGYSIAPEMEVGPDEMVVFFLSESRIVSATRGELRYANMSTDDFPNIGLEPGDNEIVALLTADAPGSPSAGRNQASAYLCWSEEFSSMDAAILYGRS